MTTSLTKKLKFEKNYPGSFLKNYLTKDQNRKNFKVRGAMAGAVHFKFVVASLLKFKFKM
jgi:hypothetical protein